MASHITIRSLLTTGLRYLCTRLTTASQFECAESAKVRRCCSSPSCQTSRLGGLCRRTERRATLTIVPTSTLQHIKKRSLEFLYNTQLAVLPTCSHFITAKRNSVCYMSKFSAVPHSPHHYLTSNSGFSTDDGGRALASINLHGPG